MMDIQYTDKDKKSFYERLENKLYSAAQIDKAVTEIDCFAEEAAYKDFLDFGRLENLPIENQDRIKRIMEKKDRGRAIYVSLLLEMKEELLDLFQDISSDKEPTIILHADEKEIAVGKESDEAGYDDVNSGG